MKAATTISDADRTSQYQAIQTQLNQVSPFVPLIQPSQHVVAASSVTGLAINPVWTIDVASLGSKWPRAGPVTSVVGPAPAVRFLIKRLGMSVLLAIGVTLITFILTNLVPGDPATANLGQQALGDPAAVKQFRQQNGLDKPLPVQYLTYLGHLLRGNLGQSQQSHRAVSSDLRDFVPATFELAGAALLISLVIGVAFGVIAALRRDRLADQFLRVVSLTGVSVPNLLAGLGRLLLRVLHVGFRAWLRPARHR